MAGTNLNSVVSTIQGVSTLWLLDYKSITALTGKLEDLTLPSISSGVLSGDFDCVGKFGEGTFSPEGDEGTVEQKKYTDGTVALSTVTKATYGVSGMLHNVNTAVCEKILGMTKVAKEATSTGIIGESDAYGITEDSGYIENAVLYLEFDKSNAYKGMLIPNSAITSKFITNGDSTDNATIQVSALFSEAPAKIEVNGTAQAFTTKYAGMTFMLLAK